MRRCTVCGIEGGEEKFARHARARASLQPRCRDCANKARRERPPREPSVGKCKECGVEGGIDVFSRSKQSSTGLRWKCKQCEKRATRQYSPSTATCVTCGRQGGEEEFYRKAGHKSGLSSKCKVCATLYSRSRKYAGVERVWEESPRCAICDLQLEWYVAGGEKRMTAQVDHDHQTGEARGILCQGCNKGIGMFRENSYLLWRASVYLNEASLLNQLEE